MPEAKRDQNRITTILAVSEVDDTTPVRIWADPTTHELLVKSSSGGGGGDVNLAQVGGATFSLGQQLASASLPVVLTASQLSTLASSANQTNGTQLTRITDGTDIMDVASGSYGKPALTVSPHDASSFSDGYANNPQNYVDENYNQVIQGVFPFMFNGTTWDRIRGETTNGLDVDVTRVVPGTGATALGKAEDASHSSGDTGVAVWGVRNDDLSTTYGGNGDYIPFATDLKGRQMVAQMAPTATLSNVAGSASSVTLLSANSSRIGAQITNDSSAVLYIKFGTTASTTSYTVTLAGSASAPFSYYEVPAGYTGRIDGIWGSASGNARISEET